MRNRRRTTEKKIHFSIKKCRVELRFVRSLVVLDSLPCYMLMVCVCVLVISNYSCAAWMLSAFRILQETKWGEGERMRASCDCSNTVYRAVLTAYKKQASHVNWLYQSIAPVSLDFEVFSYSLLAPVRACVYTVWAFSRVCAWVRISVYVYVCVAVRVVGSCTLW